MTESPRAWPFWLVVLVAGIVSFAVTVALMLAIRGPRRTQEAPESPETAAFRQALVDYLRQHGFPPAASQERTASRPASTRGRGGP